MRVQISSALDVCRFTSSSRYAHCSSRSMSMCCFTSPVPFAAPGLARAATERKNLSFLFRLHCLGICLGIGFPLFVSFALNELRAWLRLSLLGSTRLFSSPFLNVEPRRGEPLLRHLPIGDGERACHHARDLSPARPLHPSDARELLRIVRQSRALAPHREQDAAVGTELLGRHVSGVGQQPLGVQRKDRVLSHHIPPSC